ncbi:MAG: AAA domain-containing protein [Bacillota bacterium]
MSEVRPPVQRPGTLWSSLIQYYRSCLDRERELGMRVPADRNAFVLLKEIEEHLITRKAITTILTEPAHTQPVLAYLNRRGRGISGTFIYGYPLARLEGGLIPLCYTEVRLEPGSAPQTVVLTRGNAELMINRQFFVESAGLTEAEVNDLQIALRSPRSGPPSAVLDQYLLDVEVLTDAVLFASDAGQPVRGPGRELQLMEQLRSERLPDSIRIFIGEQGIPSAKPVQGMAILPVDPGQEAVLKRRQSPFLLVTGPSGSGKSQTAINLIAGAVADGQKVLYISRDEAACDRLFQALTQEEAFPGVLRIGRREVRAASLVHARRVVESLRSFEYQRENPGALAQESHRLSQELARLDGEVQEVERLEQTAAQLEVLARQVEQALEGHPHRSWMQGLVSRLTPEAAVQIQPEQLVGIRQLLVRALGWEPEGGSIGGRLRDRMRATQVKSTLRQLGVPELLHPEGDLPALVEGLVRLDQAFPLLLARARLLHTRARLAGHRSLPELRAARAEAQQARVALDRKRLRGAWLAVADKVRPLCDELLAIIDQEERALASAGAQRGAVRSQRFPDLMKAFPVVISPTFLVAGAIPNEPELFDLLVVDDASAVDIPSFLPVLYRARRVCILGDEFGRRHPTTLGEEEDSRLLGLVQGRNLAAFGYVEISVLDRAKQVVGQDQTLRLRRQYRVPPAIFDWCSEQFYQGQVRSDRPEAVAGSLLLEDVADGQTLYPAQEALSQAQNVQEAKRAIRLVTQALARGMDDLAVLTPFRGQAVLLQQLLSRLGEVEPDPARAAALRQVVVATPESLPERPCRQVIISMVAARGATPATLDWLEKQRSQLAQLVTHATERVVLVGHRATLVSAGPTLASLVAHAGGLQGQGGESRPPQPGLQPERLGLLRADPELLREWLTLPGAAAEAFSERERELYEQLAEAARGLPVLLAPRLSLARLLEPADLAALPGPEREAAAGSHLLLTVVDSRSLRPIAAVELDEGEADLPAREALCRKARLPLVPVRSGEWQVLRSVLSLVPAP